LGKTRIESAPDGRRPISLAVKRAGEPSAGNRHAGFEVAGAGNQLTVRIGRHSQRKRGANKLGRTYGAMAPVLDPTGCTYGALAPVLDPTDRLGSRKSHDTSTKGAVRAGMANGVNATFRADCAITVNTVANAVYAATRQLG